MFLATTALTEFWDSSQEQLFLGSWCLPYDKKPLWEGVRGQVMPSPWNKPGRCDRMVRRSEELQDKLLEFLSSHLDEALEERHSSRYWRILLGPWIMAYTNLILDAWLTLRVALRTSSETETIVLTPQDFVVPRDTNDYFYRVLIDSFHLQVYSELLSGMGYSFPTRRLSGPTEPDVRGPRESGRGWKTAARRALGGAARVPRASRLVEVYFGDLNIDRKDCWTLIKTSRGKLWPVGEALPESLSFAPESGSRRRGLRAFPAHDELDRLVALTLPAHFPTLYLEGFRAWRGYVLSKWPRPPQRLLTSVGWFEDDYLKMLAAESVERGGRLAICQHGGAYGIMTPLHNERHERSVADQYWTWGWKEPSMGGARLKPLPHPKLSRRVAAASSKPTDELALVCTSFPLYSYPYYFANVPAYHRFPEYLDERERFVAALPPSARDQMKVHLLPLDLGRGQKERLAARFGDLQFTTEPWLKRLGRIKLLTIDHPQTSMLEALACGIPTILFWNPTLWRSRPSATIALDALRRCGILHDNPESAAALAAKVLQDPSAWWRSDSVERARAQFCHGYALGSSDWAKLWAKAALEI